MAAKPSAETLNKAKDQLLIFKPAPIALPVHAPSPTMEPEFIAIRDHANFKKRPFAIIARSDTTPETSLHLPDDNWNLGSAGKLGVAVGAFALRHDVRKLRTASVVNSLAEADAVMEHVWSLSNRQDVKNIALERGFPIPSLVLEWDAAGVFFKGERTAVDYGKITSLPYASWTTLIPAIEALMFWEHLVNMIKASDGISTRIIQGAVGIRYTVFATEALGLFNPTTKKGLRIAGAYGPSAQGHLTVRQPITAWSYFPKGQRGSGDRVELHYCGTARTLAALINAIFTDKFIDPGASAQFRDLMLYRSGMSIDTETLVGIRKYMTENPPIVETSHDAWLKVGIWNGRTNVTAIKYGDLDHGSVLLGFTGKPTGKDFGFRVEKLMESMFPV